jgi:hypothetical protein
MRWIRRNWQSVLAGLVTAMALYSIYWSLVGKVYAEMPGEHPGSLTAMLVTLPGALAIAFTSGLVVGVWPVGREGAKPEIRGAASAIVFAAFAGPFIIFGGPASLLLGLPHNNLLLAVLLFVGRLLLMMVFSVLFALLPIGLAVCGTVTGWGIVNIRRSLAVPFTALAVASMLFYVLLQGSQIHSMSVEANRKLPKIEAVLREYYAPAPANCQWWIDYRLSDTKTIRAFCPVQDGSIAVNITKDGKAEAPVLHLYDREGLSLEHRESAICVLRKHKIRDEFIQNLKLDEDAWISKSDGYELRLTGYIPSHD